MPTFTHEQTGNAYQVATWEGLTGTEDGAALSRSKMSDKTVQISGTLDGGTVVLEGSMDGDTWHTLTSDGISEINALGLHWVWENPRYIRPSITGGGASSDVDVILCMSSLV